MSHGNARLTVHGRLLIVQRHQAGWKQAHIAAAMGVSRKCVKTWIDRYAAEGEAGLATRSSRPHTVPTRTSDEVERRVLAARVDYRDGPDGLGPSSGCRPARCHESCDDTGCPIYECDPMTGEVIRSSKPPRSATSGLGPASWCTWTSRSSAASPTAAAGAPTAVVAGDQRDRATKVGYDYVHSLVDDHSRLAYCEVLPDEKGPTCAAFLQRRSTTSPPTASPGSSG